MNRTAIITICLLVMSICHSAVAQDTAALSIARKVADKVIADTRFEFEPVIRKEQLGMQVIDFRHLLLKPGEMAIGLRNLKAGTDTVVTFGIGSGGGISIRVNGQEVYQQANSSLVVPAEFAYGRFRFAGRFSARIRKGDNEMLITYERSAQLPVVFLRPVTDSLDADMSVNFNADADYPDWRMMGPFTGLREAWPSSKSVQTYYAANGKILNWQTAPQQFLSELVIGKDATYQRDSYADWNYPNGATLWSMMAIDHETGNGRYVQHVKNYRDFILNHLPYFKWQYDSLFAYRGSYHRIFRQSMLDDSGTPALPLLELYLQERDLPLKTFLDPIAAYVSDAQVRLKDGTFCRPEPVSYTVWADDLFMSVPFLLRMGKSTGQKKYYDDAAIQVINFGKYLLDPATGLYKHGWFSTTGQRSVAYWGRANGWVIWATAEVLTWLPKEHPSYKTILQMFKAHIAAVARYQDKSGIWHQLIDHAESYEETSCTAIFTLAMARGVRKGWLNKSYKEKALAGWQAVKKQIDADGTVHGICRGTEIGMTEAFYMNRPTIDHDPRGLGAVITAAVEISKLK